MGEWVVTLLTIVNTENSHSPIKSLFSLLVHNILFCFFFQVDAFVDQAANYYGLELVRKKKPIKSALAALKSDRKSIKAGLMGTRKGDPGSEKLEAFSFTDPGWPELMRVCPILDWTYSQVWQFLLKHKVSYCSLYDHGYTSLGSKANTTPNPLLRNSENSLQYSPAYTLSDDSAERQGRR